MRKVGDIIRNAEPFSIVVGKLLQGFVPELLPGF
jgi:hypothetical protein